MNQDRILQVRLDPTLATLVRQFTEQLKSREPGANESVAVRRLLRHALAAAGVRVDFMQAAYDEGRRQAYDEARKAIAAAMGPLLEGKAPR